ncbi:hypothetical protein NDU88_007253 [Pleurodeles waltl]|uniref:Uncharacterized protein n=1 Tax=Pleurodeles waltl TaxID=8319 RepID=A0AAV7U319_PLEWA|nr:hypothetical protein NDU88_007253 [Pleurodeles waltl]
MVARAAPREQEELLKDALSRTVKTPRVRRETVERLALRAHISIYLCSVVRAYFLSIRMCQKPSFDHWFIDIAVVSVYKE